MKIQTIEEGWLACKERGLGPSPAGKLCTISCRKMNFDHKDRTKFIQSKLIIET